MVTVPVLVLRLMFSPATSVVTIPEIALPLPVYVAASILPEAVISVTVTKPALTLTSASVETPDALRSSNSVCPSTSKSPLASIAPTNVDTPDTFTLSNSVCPSTSKSPLKSAAPVKVDTPDTLRLSNSV